MNKVLVFAVLIAVAFAQRRVYNYFFLILYIWLFPIGLFPRLFHRGWNRVPPWKGRRICSSNFLFCSPQQTKNRHWRYLPPRTSWPRKSFIALRLPCKHPLPSHLCQYVCKLQSLSSQRKCWAFVPFKTSSPPTSDYSWRCSFGWQLGRECHRSQR